MHPYIAKHVEVDPVSGCWLWTGSVNEWGYGRAGHKCGERAAHRISYVLHIGPIGAGMLVLHSCDTPRCCNPEHLFQGTQADNMRDMSAKKRGADKRGEKSATAKLTYAAVADIRTRRAVGEKITNLAREFGVSRRAIAFAIKGVTWKN